MRAWSPDTVQFLIILMSPCCDPASEQPCSSDISIFFSTLNKRMLGSNRATVIWGLTPTDVGRLCLANEDKKKEMHSSRFCFFLLFVWLVCSGGTSAKEMCDVRCWHRQCDRAADLVIFESPVSCVWNPAHTDVYMCMWSTSIQLFKREMCRSLFRDSSIPLLTPLKHVCDCVPRRRVFQVSLVLSALQAGNKGTQACITAESAVSGIIADLDTTIMFASAGTLNPENEESFADHRCSDLAARKPVMLAQQRAPDATNGTHCVGNDTRAWVAMMAYGWRTPDYSC